MNDQEVNDALSGLLVDESVPKWAKILIVCCHKLSGVGGSVSDLSERVSRLEASLAVVQELTTENRLLRIQIAGLKDEMDALEQISRRNCLIIHGIDEKAREDTTAVALDIIHNTLGVSKTTLSREHIDRSHRLGRRNERRTTRSSKSRPIIVKFKGYDSRQEVFSRKKKLKGSKVMITENLTAKRYALLQKCIEKLGKGKTWTVDGRITTKKGDAYVVISNETDLDNL